MQVSNSYGINEEHALFAVENGWSRQVMYNLRDFCHEHMLWVEWINQEYVLLKNKRFITGPDQFVAASKDRGMATIEDLERDYNRYAGEVVAYCDGSGTAGKPGGAGVVMLFPKSEPVMLAEHMPGKQTNNTAELTAILRAFQMAPILDRTITIRSDSQYALDSAEGKTVPKKNEELVAKVRRAVALRRGNVYFEHVDGHDGNYHNELADALAGVARRYGKSAL